MGGELEFFAVARVAHEPEAAGAVDLQAGLQVAKERLGGAGGDLPAVERERALGPGVGLGQQGAQADDLAAG